MLMPHGDRAIVDIRKLRDYCLNSDSPRGRSMARVFAASLGLTGKDAAWLRGKLLAAARTEEARRGEIDLYGQRYTVDFEVTTRTGAAIVRSGWIILHGESAPRLTTCYVKKRKK